MKHSNFKNYLRSKSFSEKTVNSYFGDVCRFLNYCETEDIEAEQTEAREILSYVQHLKSKGNKQRSIQANLRSINHYYRWLIQRGERVHNPIQHIEIKGVKRSSLYDILSVGELEEIYQSYEATTPITKRNKQMVGMMVYQGLTVAEFNRLKIEDVTVREGKVYVRASRRSNARTLNLQAHQIIDLLEYSLQTREQILEQANKESNLFFVSTGSGEKLNNVMQKLSAELKEKHRKIRSTRQIRASVITKWLKNYNLRQAQYMAGHRYVSSTEKYLVNDWEQLKDEVEKYHPLK